MMLLSAGKFICGGAYLGEGAYLRKYVSPKPEWVLVLTAFLSVS